MECWRSLGPIPSGCQCRQEIFFFLAESGSGRPPEFLPGRDAVLSRQHSTRLLPGAAFRSVLCALLSLWLELGDILLLS